MQRWRASDWMIALLDAPEDEALHAAFERWLAADPAHARDWDEIVHTYDVMGLVTPQHRAAWAEREGAIDETGPNAVRGKVVAFPQRRRALAVMAAAMAACLAVILLPDAALRLNADHISPRGQVMALTLADGSRAQLSPESAIAVDFTDGRRIVTLLAGQAFFEVTPDPAHPFRVLAGGVEAKVLGTAFEVRDARDIIGVAVQEGKVSVTDAAGAVVLTAGDWIQVGPEDKRVQGSMNPREVAAWRDGRLIARDMPVAEAVAELRPYYNGVVILRGDGLARQPLTGVYSLTDPDAAFAAIAEAQGARLYRLSPWITIISGS